MKHKILMAVVFLLVFLGCKEEVIPKPKAMLRLEFPKSEYGKIETKNFVFDMNKAAKIQIKNSNAITVDYPAMKGSIYITHKEVGGNLNTLLLDSQKLSYEHTSKADNIIEQPFVNPEKKVFGMFYEVTGNAASQAQFYVTDSINHFVTGSLYFYAKPNYDSIYPAANYLQKDIRRIMESMEWK
jgi:gliding motility-associated lipoprotein GldD